MLECSRVVVVAFTVFACSNVIVARSASAVDLAHADAQIATTTSSITPSTYIGNLPYGCTYDVIALDGGPFGSLAIARYSTWSLRDDFGGCQPAIEDGRTVTDFPLVVDFAAPVSGPAELVTCSEGWYWEHGDPEPDPVDYTEIRASAYEATDPDGNPVTPPRLCIKNLRCDDSVKPLEWKGDPRCGDADYDDQIVATDALMALRAAAGLGPCQPVDTSCDVNDDGDVAATDALNILRFVVGSESALDCPVPCL